MVYNQPIKEPLLELRTHKFLFLFLSQYSFSFTVSHFPISFHLLPSPSLFLFTRQIAGRVSPCLPGPPYLPGPPSRSPYLAWGRRDKNAPGFFTPGLLRIAIYADRFFFINILQPWFSLWTPTSLLIVGPVHHCAVDPINPPSPRSSLVHDLARKPP
jgi:hypothetical protein